MSTDTDKEIVADLLDVGYRTLRGGQDPLNVARSLLDTALKLAPVEVLAPMLTDAARARADLIANIAEDLKFPQP
jgi:hypothetical protein